MQLNSTQRHNLQRVTYTTTPQWQSRKKMINKYEIISYKIIFQVEGCQIRNLSIKKTLNPIPNSNMHPNKAQEQQETYVIITVQVDVKSLR